jgi:hypothetical protein
MEGAPIRNRLMELQDALTDVMEMYCSPSEMERYDKLIANPAIGVDEK